MNRGDSKRHTSSIPAHTEHKFYDLHLGTDVTLMLPLNCRMPELSSNCIAEISRCYIVLNQNKSSFIIVHSL